jgi:hypothetical protein
LSTPALPLIGEYRARAATWQIEHAASERRSRQLGNARLATGLAAVVIAGLSIGAGWFSPWWLLVPLVIFILLAVLHDRVDKRRDAALRGADYYTRALTRVEHKWIGKGHAGDAFRDPQHLYADDLDLFGAGSLFELLSTSRTATGERMLAEWLRAPADLAVVRARQEAVAELKDRLDLREEMALMGEDIRAAIDDRAMKTWGEIPPVRFFAGARWTALVLAIAAVIALVLFLAQVLGARLLAGVVLAELILALLVRDGVRAVQESVSTPARELKLLGQLLGRLEKESFTSPHLQRLTHAVGGQSDTPGHAASAEIRRLERLVDHLDSSRNEFFRLLALPLLWKSQFAMAIEAWRRQSGPHIAQWIAAVGEFEALCSLACFAYERPGAVFPELVESAEPLLEGTDVKHPLIDPAHAVGNDVALGAACALWIVSGSNMSGKSTWLRAVGLNAVLAWAGAPVCCARLRLSPLRIGASIRVNDSLADNKSRFYAEISRLRDIVNLARGGQPTLFLLDELLSGTNSHDRRIGAAAVIRGLVEKGAIGFVTTHDLALAEIAAALGGCARNVHFEDHIENGEIHFDYHLRDGVVERSNALELMRAVGLDV